MAAPAARRQQQRGIPAHPVDDLKNARTWSGCRWISLDVSGHPSEGNSLDVSGSRLAKNLNPDNNLRRSLAFCGSPWKVEVERVKGTARRTQIVD